MSKQPRSPGFGTGAMGLPHTLVGSAVQELCTVLEDRGWPHDQIVHQLRDGVEHGWFDEGTFWEDVLGPAVDRLAEHLDLTAFPEEDE